MATRKPSFLTNSVPQTANTLQKFKIPLFDLTAWPASGQCGRHRLSIGYIGAMLKYLRIAVTALSLTACVLLIALWVRSYWRFDQVIHRASATDYWVAVTSARGQVAFGGGNEPILSTIFKQDWVHRGFAMKGVDNESGSPIPVFPVDLPNSAILLWPHFKSPFLVDQSTSYELRVPYWLLVLTSAAFAASPWLLWHFSLRTLLIAMTLVAVAMGVFAVSS